MAVRTDLVGLLRLVLLGLIAAGLVAVVVRGVPVEGVRSLSARLREGVGLHPVLAPLALWAVYTAIAGLTLPVNIPFALMAGALFGFAEGVVVVSCASACGATLSMLSSRFLFRDLVRARLGDRLATMEAGIAREGTAFLLMLRLVPAVPYTVTNLAYGLTATPVWRFHLVGQLGMLPASMIYVEAGTRLDGLASVSDLLSPGLLAALLALAALPLAARVTWGRLRQSRVNGG